MDEPIHHGFWKDLPRPFFALAPMEDVTDTVFRTLIHSLAKPHVFFTEFVMSSGIVQGRKDSLARLRKEPIHRPLVAQIWGTKPEDFKRAAGIIRNLGFDGVDINMGCPQASITSKGACSALIKNPRLAKEIILATKEGAQSGANPIPVSVKTRVSFSHPPQDEGVVAWLTTVLETNPAVLTIHGRSAEQQSEGDANWNHVTTGVRLRDQNFHGTAIMGNGDVQSIDQGQSLVSKTGCDGIMIGRGIFNNPNVFRPLQLNHHGNPKPFPLWEQHEKIALALYHLNLYEAEWAGTRNFHIMKKFFKIYLQGFEGADDLRQRIMETENYASARDILALS